MSDFSKTKLPDHLPQCACFQTNLNHTWARIEGVANINVTMCELFDQLVKHMNLCPSALMFTIENTITTLLAYTARAKNHELTYGSMEIEREAELLLKGIEERVLSLSRYAYQMGRVHGMTEENVRAMHEGRGETKQ